MNIISETAEKLLKEKENSLLIEKQYMDEMNKLPKGTIEVKQQYNKEYYYYTYYDRDAPNKKISEFLGNDKSAAYALKEKLDRRRYLTKDLKELRKYLKAIDDMLKIANKYTQQNGIREVLKEPHENNDASMRNQSEIFKTLPSPIQETSTLKK